MLRHTPGPWHVGFKDDGTFDDTIPVCSGIKPGEMVIACVWPIESEVADESDISHANAKLVAAAPRLFMACRMLLATTCKFEGKTGITHVGKEGWEAVRDAVEAILGEKWNFDAHGEFLEEWEQYWKGGAA